MKETGFVAYQHEVKAILEGRQTMFRRVIKLPPAPNHLGQWEPITHGGAGITDSKGNATVERPAIWHTRTGKLLVCPYGQVGDRLWVREAFYTDNYRRANQLPVLYRADGEFRSWKSSIHMPRWASRITLEITGVKVERLFNITLADIQAEGIVIDPELRKLPDTTHAGAPNYGKFLAIRLQFAELWDSINAKRGYGFDVNPWDWALTFKRVK